MRKTLSFIILIFSSCFFFTSCNVYRDFFQNNNCDDCPLWHHESEWECTNPDITFFVYEEPKDENSSYWPSGVIEYQGEQYYFTLEFDYLRTIYFVPSEKDTMKKKHYCVPEKLYFSGICIYSEDQFTVEIDKNTDSIFDGKYDTILFTKVEAEQNE
ncbi:MAG: hypothetical protein J6D27_09015 [Ruminiclostridium sp.]|nr:hypothetical protein [Ruminiclostridium sp.]